MGQVHDTEKIYSGRTIHPESGLCSPNTTLEEHSKLFCCSDTVMLTFPSQISIGLLTLTPSIPLGLSRLCSLHNTRYNTRERGDNLMDPQLLMGRG